MLTQPLPASFIFAFATPNGYCRECCVKHNLLSHVDPKHVNHDKCQCQWKFEERRFGNAGRPFRPQAMKVKHEENSNPWRRFQYLLGTGAGVLSAWFLHRSWRSPERRTKTYLLGNALNSFLASRLDREPFSFLTYQQVVFGSPTPLGTIIKNHNDKVKLVNN